MLCIVEASNAVLTSTASGSGGQTLLTQTPNTASFSGKLTATGVHLLCVCLQDFQTQQKAQLQASTKLRGVKVLPAAVCPHRTAVQALPDRLVAGQGCDFRICPVDAYGNAGASGAACYHLFQMSHMYI